MKRKLQKCSRCQECTCSREEIELNEDWHWISSFSRSESTLHETFDRKQEERLVPLFQSDVLPQVLMDVVSSYCKRKATDIEIGDLVSARDGSYRECVGVIIAMKREKVFVHYMAWPSSWDEWIDSQSDRLSPLADMPAMFFTKFRVWFQGTESLYKIDSSY